MTFKKTYCHLKVVYRRKNHTPLPLFSTFKTAIKNKAVLSKRNSEYWISREVAEIKHIFKVFI